MSGYPLRTAYDATQKRKKYLEELALRAKLDDENLQANKLYKRTGAISTPPDTRTTTEKLSDLYRLRIDIRSKLGQLMSGDDAQKVAGELDEDELVFLSSRIDKYIADLKPKYALGMPYQAFNAYFTNAIEAYNSLGDIDLSTAVLLQNMISPDDLDRVIKQVKELTTSYEQKTFEGLSNMYKSLMSGIEQSTKLITDGIITYPRAIQDIQQVIQDAQQQAPSQGEIQQLQSDIQQYNTGFFPSEADRQALLNEIRRRLALYNSTLGTLQNETEKIKDVTKRTSSLVPSGSRTRKVLKPIDGVDYISKDRLDGMSHSLLKDYVRAIKKIVDDGKNIQDKNEYKRLKFKITASKDEILDKLKNPEVDDFLQRLWTDYEVAQQMPGQASILGLETQLANVKLKKTPAPAPKIDPTLLVNLNQQQQSGSTSLSRPPSPPFSPAPPAQAPAPAPAPTGNSLLEYAMRKNPNIQRLVENILNENQSYTTNIIIQDIDKMLKTRSGTNKYDLKDKSDKKLLVDYIEEYLNDLLADLIGGIGPQTDFTEFVRNKQATSATGKGLHKRMKGGSVKIDKNAGIPPQEKQANYVPFGKYILNRNKLNDGVVMIKRPNGAFMGDLQSRRISNNLKNIFQKVVGGSIPNFQDLSKLDDDEKEYLHYVAKKTNLVDKLQVPTPKKDEDERMINRFEVLRGQIVAGNDNIQLINEFKKLVLEMSDKKLLPRRQVSDILIDLERAYG
jgi:hypothetical protein